MIFSLSHISDHQKHVLPAYFDFFSSQTGQKTSICTIKLTLRKLMVIIEHFCFDRPTAAGYSAQHFIQISLKLTIEMLPVIRVHYTYSWKWLKLSLTVLFILRGSAVRMSALISACYCLFPLWQKLGTFCLCTMWIKSSSCHSDSIKTDCSEIAKPGSG